jgi:amino acid adenylation domain-containing protein
MDRPSITADQMVSRQIAALGKLCPESTALSRGGHRLTFRELNRKADLFAEYLGQCGVLPGATVAIILERSFEWIIAALGIMRAAAAYVPLDPTWPDSRLCYAVKDSHASILVSRSELSDRLQIGIPCIDPYRDAATIDGSSTSSMGRTVAPETLAYVIYTSGSTGVPKGVEITHANLAHLTRWHRDAFHLTPKDRVSHLAGVGFDAAGWEIWPNLCAGAAVILVDEAVRWSPELIQQWIIRERVTVSFVPTIHATPLMSMQWPGNAELRCLLTGGDVLQQSPPPGLPFAVVNNYGPTECTVVSTSGLVGSGGHQTPSIGCPVDGASLYLLDELGRPVPDGTPGEIYIGGNGVGRGYRNLDASTAKCFLPDRFSPVPSARMFRTGDRAARLPNGEIQFLGRLDRQVKIRGYRIELDEIGTVLSRHPGVAFATAMAAFSKGGDAILVGYVLPKKDVSKPTTHELQTYLLNWLPDYMVPSTIVELQSLPLTANGKLDFTALSQLRGLHQPVGLALAPPLSPIAGELLTIVRQLLENEAVTAEDNFFLAGGHSLLGMQLLVRIQSVFGVTMTLQELYEAQTVDCLAVFVEKALTESRLTTIWKEVLALKSVGPSDDFSSLGGNPQLVASLCQRISTEFGQKITIADIDGSPTIRRQAELMWGRVGTKHSLPSGVVALRPGGTRNRIFWMHYLGARLASAIKDDQPFFSVSLTAHDVELLGEAPGLKTIATHLLQKLRATQPAGPYILGGYCVGGVLAYEIACQLQAAAEEVRLLVMVDPPNPSCNATRSTIAERWAYLRYLIRRAEWLGPRASIIHFLERLMKRFPRSWGLRLDNPEAHISQELIESAVFSYRPGEYGGRALLFLPSEPRPHVKPFLGWQTVGRSNLQTHYVGAYHRELMDPENAHDIAEVIALQLEAIDGQIKDGEPVRAGASPADGRAGACRSPAGATEQRIWTLGLVDPRLGQASQS